MWPTRRVPLTSRRSLSTGPRGERFLDTAKWNPAEPGRETGMPEILTAKLPKLPRPVTGWRVPMAPGRPYLDTTVVHFMTLPSEIPELRATISGGVRPSRVRFDSVAANDSWLVSLHQPTGPEEQLRFGKLQRKFSDPPYSARLSRFDIAFDFEPKPGESIEGVREWLERCVTIRDRKTQPTIDYYGTYYTGDFRSAVLGALYSDALGKLSNAPCVHFEPRIQSARSVGRSGYTYADELVSLDPDKHWDENVVLVHNRPEKTVAELADLFSLMKAFSPTSTTDAEQYAQAHVERFELYRAQTLKDFHPRAFKPLHRIPTLALGLPRTLEWGAVKRHQRHKKHIFYLD